MTPLRVEHLDLEALPVAQTTRLSVELVQDGLGRPIRVPVLVARGRHPGPVVGLTAAVHGNELNGIPLLHRLFASLEHRSMRGTVVGVLVVNVPGLHLNQRAFSTGEDLNHAFPGRSDGTEAQVYVHALMDQRHPDRPAPLRARGSDVLLLAHHFLERIAARANKPIVGISNRAAARLLSYTWPGNVRELVNCIERAVALTRSDEVQVKDLPPRIRDYQVEHVVVASEDPTELVPMSVVESRYVQRVLLAVGGNKSQAARILGMDRKTLHRKMRHYGLEGAPEPPVLTPAGDPAAAR